MVLSGSVVNSPGCAMLHRADDQSASSRLPQEAAFTRNKSANHLVIYTSDRKELTAAATGFKARQGCALMAIYRVCEFARQTATYE